MSTRSWCGKVFVFTSCLFWSFIADALLIRFGALPSPHLLTAHICTTGEVVKDKNGKPVMEEVPPEEEDAEAAKKEAEEEEEEKAKVREVDLLAFFIYLIAQRLFLFTLFAHHLLFFCICTCSTTTQEDDDSELKALITSFKNLTGLWDIDPDDSAWYHLEQKDKNDPSIVVPMGSICYRYACVGVLVFVRSLRNSVCFCL